MKPIFILTDESNFYMTVYYPTGQPIQSVVEYIINEVQNRRMTRLDFDIKEFYFAYESQVIILNFCLEGISWKIV